MKGLKALIGKEVQIYPGDTNSKYGVVESVSEVGVIFKITRSEDEQHMMVGTQHFISFASKLSFRTMK